MDGANGEVVVTRRWWAGEMPGSLELLLKLSTGMLLALRWDDAYAYVGLGLFADDDDADGVEITSDKSPLPKATLVPLCAEVQAKAEEWRDAHPDEYSAGGAA